MATEQHLAERAPSGFWRDAETFRRVHTRSDTTFFSAHVNYRLGALLAHAVHDRRVTPNQLTVLAVSVSVVVSGIVMAAPRVSAAVQLVAILGWQLGYAVDCADGQLARARRTSSPFGAWLDQCGDFIAHTAMLTAIAVVIARGLDASATTAAAIGGLTLGANLFMLFATSQYNTLLGSARSGSGHGQPPRLVATLGRNVTDYGVFLLAAGASLRTPWLLLAVVGGAGALQTAAVVGQIALNWRRAAA